MQIRARFDAETGMQADAGRSGSRDMSGGGADPRCFGHGWHLAAACGCVETLYQHRRTAGGQIQNLNRRADLTLSCTHADQPTVRAIIQSTYLYRRRPARRHAARSHSPQEHRF